MALFGDDQGRTEKATPGRLNEARNRGDTHLSRELLTGGTLLVAAIQVGFDVLPATRPRRTRKPRRS